MAHRKAGGVAKNSADSNAQYLGIKITDGQKVKVGQLILRQRGTKVLAGEGVGIGKDHTLFALVDGIVKFSSKRKINFDNTKTVRKIINIIPEENNSDSE